MNDVIVDIFEEIWTSSGKRKRFQQQKFLNSPNYSPKICRKLNILA